MLQTDAIIAPKKCRCGNGKPHWKTFGECLDCQKLKRRAKRAENKPVDPSKWKSGSLNCRMWRAQ